MNPLLPLGALGAALALSKTAESSQGEHGSRPVPGGSGLPAGPAGVALGTGAIKELGSNVVNALEGAHWSPQAVDAAGGQVKFGEAFQSGDYQKSGEAAGMVLGGFIGMTMGAAPTVAAAQPVLWGLVGASIGVVMMACPAIAGYYALIIIAIAFIADMVAMGIEWSARGQAQQNQNASIAAMFTEGNYRQAMQRVIDWNSDPANYKVMLPIINNLTAGATKESIYASTIAQWQAVCEFGPTWALHAGWATDYRNVIGQARPDNPNHDGAKFTCPPGSAIAGQTIDCLEMMRKLDAFFYDGWRQLCEYLKRKPTWEEWTAELSKTKVDEVTVLDILNLRNTFVRAYCGICPWVPGGQTVTSTPVQYSKAMQYWADRTAASAKPFPLGGVPPNKYDTKDVTAFDVPGEYLGAFAATRGKWGPYLTYNNVSVPQYGTLTGSIQNAEGFR